MKRHWHEDELAEAWSLTFDELSATAHRTDYGRLGLAVLVKFVQVEGRFPERHSDVPEVVLDYLAEQLGVSSSAFSEYDLTGRTAKRDREKAREITGFHTFSVSNDQTLLNWLYTQIPLEKEENLGEAARAWCKAQRLEPPTNARLGRLVSSAVHSFEQQVFEQITAKLSVLNQASLDALLILGSEEADGSSDTADEEDDLHLSALRADPGRIGVKSVVGETAKLERLGATNLPHGLFNDVPTSFVEKYAARAATEPLRELRRHPAAVRYTLLAAFCTVRRKQVIDGLVDLLISVVHKIGVRAERKVVQLLLQDFRKVRGKTTLLFRLAEAAIANPDGVVREVLYPVAGEETLSDLVREFKTSGPAYQQQVHTVMRSSYGSHYRRLLPVILQTLTFRSNNALHRPIIDALDLLQRIGAGRRYLSLEEAPLDGVIKPSQQDLVVESDPQGNVRVNRINYEIYVLQALRDKLRCKEIWVEGAERFCNPDADLPDDFAAERERYYALLEQPLGAEIFVTEVKTQLEEALANLNETLPANPKVKLRPHGKSRIQLSPLEPQPEPTNLTDIKGEVLTRWPMTSLLDVLKETDVRLGLTQAFRSLAQREVLSHDERQKRLLLCLFGLGTNTGLKRVSGSDEGVSYGDLLYMRRRYVTKANLRSAITEVVNATLAVRRPTIWGEGTTACASDAKKFGAWDQNLMTEWHIRYGGRGVMIYWHVEKNACCIYSQLKRCSSSEVAAMIEGVLKHCTDMSVEKNYVDSHGQSEVAFAFCHLLGFDLLPRLKGIARAKLALPEAGSRSRYPNLEPILTKPINWDLIRQQYDEMIKFATALKLGTAEPEAILRRFTRNNVQHPTYRALSELGKAVKTLFLCRYLSSEALRREIHEGLNVIETWNSTNSFIFYGKGGEVATNRLEDQEVSVLALHLLQMCLVYINTLMLQDVLADEDWRGKMTKEDFRALSPLIYAHVNPYGSFELDMEKRLDLAA